MKSPQRKRKPKKKNWEKLADAERSRIIRSVGRCEMCGREGVRGKKSGWTNLYDHHIIERGHKAYRHELLNGICLCSYCHKRDILSPHKDKQTFMAWLRQVSPKRYRWYMANTVEKEKQVGTTTVVFRVPIEKRREISCKETYEILKEK